MSVAPDFLVQIYYTIKTNLEKLSDHIATLNSVHIKTQLELQVKEINTGTQVNRLKYQF